MTDQEAFERCFANEQYRSEQLKTTYPATSRTVYSDPTVDYAYMGWLAAKAYYMTQQEPSNG